MGMVPPAGLATSVPAAAAAAVTEEPAVPVEERFREELATMRDMGFEVGGFFFCVRRFWGWDDADDCDGCRSKIGVYVLC